MTRHRLRSIALSWAAATAAVGCIPAARARATSDLLPPEQRRLSVDLAARLAQPVTPEALPANIPQPFNPPGFDRPDPAEGPATKVPGAPLPPTDRETLTRIAARISPSGTIFAGATPMLMFGKKFVRIGSHLTVTYKGTDYDLELIAIDRTTFTLRLNHEEITRPISQP